MKLNLSHWSLKTRITLFTLVIFVVGIWSLSFYASRMLEKDMQHLLGNQQFSTATYVAAQINGELSERMQYLQAIADSISPVMLRNPAKLQAFLEQENALQIMFNAGAFITRTEGTAIASVPLSAERFGINYMDRDYILAALNEGKSSIGRPIMGRTLKSPVFVVATPIRDRAGNVIGSLSGVTNLGKPNFLDKITESSYGKSGGYVLLIPKLRLIVTATDKSRIMQALPPRGAVPTLDQFLEGYEGSAIYVNPLGVEVLGSAKTIPVADWLLGVTLPTTEALAPIREMQGRVLLATFFFTLLAGTLTWWMLRRQLSPMLAAVQHMSALVAGNQPPQALPVTRQDEIGTLITGFNRMLETMAQRAAALKESDGRAATLIETSPLPLALNDEQGNIIYLNQAFIKTIGYSLNEIPTLEHWWPLAYPEQKYRQWVADRWQKNIEDAQLTQQPFAPIEINVMCKDGLVRTFMASASAFEGGFSKTHLVILYDITESKKTQQALMASNLRLSEAQQFAHIGNWSADMVSGELYWSDEIYRIFGHQPGSFAPSLQAFHAAVHPEDVTLVAQSEKVAQQTGRHDVVHRIVRPDGSVRYVHELAHAEFDAAGKMVRLSGTVQDVTEMKQAELALVATTKRLNDAQRMALIGNWSLDLQSGELSWSDEIFHMFEIDPNKFGATYEAFLNTIHPDDRAAVNEAYSNSLVTREPYEITHRLRMNDGRIKWVVEKCMSDFDAAGKPLRSRGMVQDITRLKQVEFELIAARDLAEKASKAKSDFLSSMSHELRTPMNAILGFGQVLDYDESISGEQRVCVKEILGAGFHLIELINEVLDLSQIESGNLKLSMESVELCAVITESIKLVDVLADKRNIKISHAGQEGVTVHADRIRLKQALLNLLSNAIKYNREGGSVHVEVQSHGANRLRILVRDTGMGIPAAKMRGVFQAFNRLGAENSNIMGAGIGLTITRRIIEMMGGSVEVESEEGVGSLFWIELPTEFMPIKAQETPAMQSKDTGLQPQEPSKYNVLYIEDNPSNLRLVTQLFTQRKYIHLISAHTPELGIDLAFAQRPDLILLDINMPGMSGYQVLEVFKSDKRLEGVPVIAVTASAMVSDIEHGMAAGFSEYLTKPLDIANFYNVIDRYLSAAVGHHKK